MVGPFGHMWLRLPFRIFRAASLPLAGRLVGGTHIRADRGHVGRKRSRGDVCQRQYGTPIRPRDFEGLAKSTDVRWIFGARLAWSEAGLDS